MFLVLKRSWVSREAGCRHWQDTWIDPDIPECTNGTQFVRLTDLTAELGSKDFTTITKLTQCLVRWATESETLKSHINLWRRPVGTTSTNLSGNQRNQRTRMAKGHLSWLSLTPWWRVSRRRSSMASSPSWRSLAGLWVCLSAGLCSQCLTSWRLSGMLGLTGKSNILNDLCSCFPIFVSLTATESRDRLSECSPHNWICLFCSDCCWNWTTNVLMSPLEVVV